MSATLDLINKEIARLKKKLAVLEEKIARSPAAEIGELHKKALEARDAHKDDYEKLSEVIGPLAVEEKKLMALLKEQMGNKLWDKKHELMMTIDELQGDIWKVSRR